MPLEIVAPSLTVHFFFKFIIAAKALGTIDFFQTTCAEISTAFTLDCPDTLAVVAPRHGSPHDVSEVQLHAMFG